MKELNKNTFMVVPKKEVWNEAVINNMTKSINKLSSKTKKLD